LLPKYDYPEMWYLCELTEKVESETPEPDWSRVPESKRELVRERWKASQIHEVTSKVYLWGPQIPFFARQYTVRPLQ
jgi:hypothetical protein